MKKVFKIIIALVLILAVAVVGIKVIGGNNLKKLDYHSKNIYVYDRTNEKELLSIKADERVYPASLVKIMTTLVAVENISDLSEIAPVDVETYKRMNSSNASMAGFYGRERVTYRDLLYGTMLASGGEAANSLAINISGSVDKYVEMMNDKAKELELKNTAYKNPEGLDVEGQYSSAKDIAMIVNSALNNNDFRAVFTKKSYTTTKTLDHPSGIVLKSTVLSKLDEYEQDGFEVLGGKSGTTLEAGECWATLSKKGENEYIIVVMGSELDNIKDLHYYQVEDTLNILNNIK
ncbi:D-alanyl-D-alanine carboxypeptidase (penicillin-binding protein 5/6) [Anaerosphaera aminiphila DSM 21120]|uniref:D-alanyl-D-alanine carboxypeptidase (Penicillin-binding protein 5/6) n=1 Tax=Anaerosphaera aminiphila DSM 21120 TaxID=1120995 RepID=A0A1M5UBI3_9FIRM|nr:serine hydrolase [Anaerosphaera aminiphila]SHH60329.1 D-alanyl-D-alanine carboxypeptidase (penicillin-binding protein 5/6) [Anaerosphaera aminiphila DSM 21120]